MSKHQLNIEIVLNPCSTIPSKLLPIENMIIDLSEEWVINNCVIARIILTQLKEIDKILAIPQFIMGFLNSRDSRQ